MWGQVSSTGRWHERTELVITCVVVAHVWLCRYINFYMANGGAVVPQYGDIQRDAAALEILAQELPGRTVVGVQSRAILVGGGNIHCITMQQPAAAAVSSC